MTDDAPRTPTRAAAHRVTVVSAGRLSPSMVRVTVAGPTLRLIEAPSHTDAYVKLVFAGHDPDAPWPTLPDGLVDLAAIRARCAPDHQPRLRSYTVRTFDAPRAELTFDVVVHGTTGLAGPWAAHAMPGDELLIVGPGGGYAPDPAADWHLLVGDHSALPAVATALERLAGTAPGARGHAVLEVPDADDELDLVAPVGITVHWVHRRGAAAASGLVHAVQGLAWPPGRVHAFVHGEAGVVRELRLLLRVDRRLAKDDLSISGYWRRGATDEGWRAAKRAWTRSIEDAESAAGLL